MCVDYTNLNKHYPKDPFGLAWIDEVVCSLRLNYHIIDVGLDILLDLVLEASLDSPLVGGVDIF